MALKCPTKTLPLDSFFFLIRHLLENSNGLPVTNSFSDIPLDSPKLEGQQGLARHGPLCFLNKLIPTLQLSERLYWCDVGVNTLVHLQLLLGSLQHRGPSHSAHS